jgi:hypothetical protein
LGGRFVLVKGKGMDRMGVDSKSCCLFVWMCVCVLGCTSLRESDSEAAAGSESLETPEIRAIYGGIPDLSEAGVENLHELGVNAVFLGSGSIDSEKIEFLRSQGTRIFAEFNTMHVASFLEDFPDAAPLGPDGKPSPAPHGWQGICPTHETYRKQRMQAFRDLVTSYPLDGVWLDYHHAHSSWEREDPALPDTCFCERCLSGFQAAMGVSLPTGSAPEKARALLGELSREWVQWRCGVFTDWVREFRSIIEEVRPTALLGSFHNPWSDSDHDGARMRKLAIDLKAQAKYLDVFSPMPYHARFGHANDPEWISRQVGWLGSYLGIDGRAGESKKIWPIVQLSDWGEAVPPSQVRLVLREAAKAPSTGVIVFAWGSLRKQPAKVELLWQSYREMQGGAGRLAPQ